MVQLCDIKPPYRSIFRFRQNGSKLELFVDLRSISTRNFIIRQSPAYSPLIRRQASVDNIFTKNSCSSFQFRCKKWKPSSVTLVIPIKCQIITKTLHEVEVKVPLLTVGQTVSQSVRPSVLVSSHFLQLMTRFCQHF